MIIQPRHGNFDMFSFTGKPSGLADIMTVYVAAGFGSEDAYKLTAERLDSAPAFDVLSAEAYNRLQAKFGLGIYPKNVYFSPEMRLRLGETYARFGDVGDARLKAEKIGFSFLKTGDAKSAAKIFSEAGISHERVLRDIDDLISGGIDEYREIRKSYEAFAIEEIKTKELEHVKRVKERMTENYLPAWHQLFIRKKEISRDIEVLDRHQKLCESDGTYRIWDIKEFNELLDDYTRISKTTNLTKLRKELEEVEDDIKVITERYHNDRDTLEKSSRKYVQDHAKGIGCMRDIFPEWKDAVEKGELDINTHKGRKYLKREARSYVKDGMLDNAIEIFGVLGKKRAAMKLRKKQL